MTSGRQNHALFVTNPTNIRYLTGFVGVDTRDSYLLVDVDMVYLFTNALYREQAKHTTCRLPNTTIRTIEISGDNPISKALERICKERNITELAFEESDLTVTELRKLNETLTGITLIPELNRIETVRMTKSTKEIEDIRLAAKLTDQCFTYITKRIRPGITEARLAWEIESFLKMKAGDVAFSPIVAFNQNSSQPHYAARGNNPLRKNSLILLDFGARVNGYCADMTRVVFLGTPKQEWIHAYETVSAASSKALDLLSRGERNGATVDAASRESIAKSDLPVYPHSLGHAVGLDIHEKPRLTVKQNEILTDSMCITVEPGVYVEGLYGIRIEDLVCIREHGIQILSNSNKDLTIL